jgi:membrane-associated phospholipid phosphatase
VNAAGEAQSAAGRGLALLRRLDVNARATLAILFRAPRPDAEPAIRIDMLRLSVWAGIAIAAVLGTMALIDPWSIANVRRLPVPLVESLDRLTDLGRSGWFLFPAGFALIALALRDAYPPPPFARRVLSIWAIRIGFVFAAIAVPGLFVAIVKRLIGRARPLVDGIETWAYKPLGWQVEYASLPSGHTATAFSALVAIGALFPHARALMWIYAVMIALSRVAVTAHHPSDVLAGAIVGAFGAILVRDWFAARKLGFFIDAQGRVQARPGPSLRRIAKALVQAPRAASH